ncbi:hypothetical protein [Oceanobacillus sp. CAU 1775]
MEKETCITCGEYVPVGAADDFCIPHCDCPEKIDQPSFPSPTTCMSSDETDLLEARINKANQKLLNLALSGERGVNEVFQNAFDGLQGQAVKVKLHSSSGKKQSRWGRVILVGFDFVLLETKSETEIIIPYEKIMKLKLRGRYRAPEDEAELEKIEPCFRRRLAFQFGKTVAVSPELIQIFFRLSLSAYLLLMVNKRVRVALENYSVKGELMNVYKDRITLRAGKDKIEVKIADICSISILENSKKKATVRD